MDRPALVRRRLHDRPQRRRPGRAAAGAEAAAPRSCGCCSSAAPRSARACRSCSAAFEALVEHVPARLTVVGADHEEVERTLRRPRRSPSTIDALGRVSRDVLWRAPRRRRRPLRPLARGRELRHGPDRGVRRRHARSSPREIAGYSDVVTDGVDGVLVPPADPQALAEELQRLHLEPERRAAMGEAARAQRRALRLAARRRARSSGSTSARSSRAASRRTRPSASPRRAGLVAADGGPRLPAQRAALARPRRRTAGRTPARVARRVGARRRRRPRRRADRARRATDRRRQRRREHRPLRLHLGPGRDRADGRLDVPPRRLVVRDRARGAAAVARCAAATSPRRR